MRIILILCFLTSVLGIHGQSYVGKFEYFRRNYIRQRLELKSDSTFNLTANCALRHRSWYWLFHKPKSGVTRSCNGIWSFSNGSIMLRPTDGFWTQFAYGFWSLEQDTLVQILSPNKLKYNGYIMKRKKPKQK